MNNNNPDREPTIKELEEKLRRKRLQEELAKKAQKQSRDHDESMLGVCHTCHVPIYYGEPIHKLQTLDSESSHSGIAGGVYGDGAFGGGYKAGSKSHSALEGWIQCGFCYGSWKEEVKKFEKWEKGWNRWGAYIGVPFGIISAVLALVFEKTKGQWLAAGIIGLVAGCLIGGLVWYLIRGKKPDKPDRYKVRKNPFRDTLIWKLDNEGKPIKEGSQQINKWGMILDPERDKTNIKT